MKHLIWLLLLIPMGAWGQVSNPPIVLVSSAPSGSCTQNLPDQQVKTTGALYSCQSGTWTQIGGGGGSGTVSDGSGTTTAGLMAQSTGTAHVQTYDPDSGCPYRYLQAVQRSVRRLYRRQRGDSGGDGC